MLIDYLAGMLYQFTPPPTVDEGIVLFMLSPISDIIKLFYSCQFTYSVILITNKVKHFYHVKNRKKCLFLFVDLPYKLYVLIFYWLYTLLIFSSNLLTF